MHLLPQNGPVSGHMDFVLDLDWLSWRGSLLMRQSRVLEEPPDREVLQTRNGFCLLSFPSLLVAMMTASFPER